HLCALEVRSVPRGSHCQPNQILFATRERRERDSARHVATDLTYAAVAQTELHERGRRPECEIPDEVGAGAATMPGVVAQIREPRRPVPRAERELGGVGPREAAPDPETALSRQARSIPTPEQRYLTDEHRAIEGGRAPHDVACGLVL